MRQPPLHPSPNGATGTGQPQRSARPDGPRAATGHAARAAHAGSPVQPGRRKALWAGLASSLTTGLGASLPGLLAGCASPPGAPAAGATAVAAAGLGTVRPIGPAAPTGRRLAIGPLSAAQSYRLVNRLSWGANEAELARLAALGPDAYVQAQLSPQGDEDLPAPVLAQLQAQAIQRQSLSALVTEVEGLRRRGTPEANAGSTEAERAQAQQAYQRHLTGLAREAANRHLWRALYSRHQLHAQMVWFWFNHFNVHQFKAQLRAVVGDFEERALRPHALGRFRDLLGAVVRHPAMLVYLDNAQNSVNRLNENLARELLELHTLGVDGGYTQADVQALARVLTGHGVNYSGQPARVPPARLPLLVQDGAYEFNPVRHDFSDKTLLGQSVAGQGAAELDQVLDRLARHPATARHLCRKMAHYLLGEAPQAALVNRMAEVFLREDGSIPAALQVLVAAPEFVAEPTAARAVPFKDPMHFVVSAVRAAWARDTPVLNTGPMQAWLGRLGQGLYNRQTPDGYPLGAEGWNGSGQLATRFEVARIIGAGVPQLFRAEGDAGATVVSAAQAGARAGAGADAGTAKATAPAVPARPAAAPAPNLLLPGYRQALEPLLREPTRQVLAGATTPAQRNMLWLSSPEFMLR